MPPARVLVGLLILLGAFTGVPSLSTPAAAHELPVGSSDAPYDAEHQGSLSKQRRAARPATATVVLVSSETSAPPKTVPELPSRADRTVSLIGALAAIAVMLVGGLTFRWFVNRDRRQQTTPTPAEPQRDAE